MDSRYVMILVVVMMALSPALAVITVKDSVTLFPIQNARYESYVYPHLNLIEFGIFDANGTAPSSNVSRWLVVSAEAYEPQLLLVENNQTIYLSAKELCFREIDLDCGIYCEAPRNLTEDCVCLCDSLCPRATVQNGNCECVFPMIFGPLHMETTELYSEYMIITRVASYSSTGLQLIEKPAGCRLYVEDSNGKTIKTNPCASYDAGAISCAFAVDDDFYSDEKYLVNINCGNANKYFNVTITDASNSMVFNRMVMWVTMSRDIGAIIIALIAGFFIIRGLKK